jgi:dihydrofolate reductase
MNKVTCGIAVSVDGFVAGYNLSEEKPFGDMKAGLLHQWMFNEPEQHTAELDSLVKAPGSFIMGRNMYGPAGPEYDETWRGWWGNEPPYHAPVFVLTHRARDPIVMKGGTTFNFVTDGIESALKQAKAAAGTKPVAIAGGASTANQYLAADLIDELWLHIVPLTVGKGVRLFENVHSLKMEPIDHSGTKLVTHIRYRIIHSK